MHPPPSPLFVRTAEGGYILLFMTNVFATANGSSNVDSGKKMA